MPRVGFEPGTAWLAGCYANRWPNPTPLNSVKERERKHFVCFLHWPFETLKKEGRILRNVGLKGKEERKKGINNQLPNYTLIGYVLFFLFLHDPCLGLPSITFSWKFYQSVSLQRIFHPNKQCKFFCWGLKDTSTSKVDANQHRWMFIAKLNTNFTFELVWFDICLILFYFFTKIFTIYQSVFNNLDNNNTKAYHYRGFLLLYIRGVQTLG